MKRWFSRSLRKQQRQAAAKRRVSAPPARSSRFELLEARRMLTVDFQTLHSFTGTATDGGLADASLTLVGSTLFGTTEVGGTDGDGTIFSINTDGTGFQILHSFSGVDGDVPEASLTVAGSTLFGTTESGGSAGAGTVFSINTDGSGFQVLDSFSTSSTLGYEPEAGVTVVGSTLFGTTTVGGGGGDGAVFSMSTTGSALKVLHSFSGADGDDPEASLTLAGSTLYGTTALGGSDGDGTVFSIGTGGTAFQVLDSFSTSSALGYIPEASVTIVGSTLYGTTSELSGSGSFGAVFSMSTSGSDLQVLHAFSDTDGAYPRAGLTLVGSTLVGTTEDGGGQGIGTIFSVNTDGSDFQTLHSFSGADGEHPVAESTPGGSALYGTTLGAAGFGTVFSLNALAVTPSGTTNTFSVGGAAVAVDSGLTVFSSDTDLERATATISSGTLQPGDSLNFTNQNGISGVYSGGVLTLTGSATVAQYQTALQSVTFSSTSTGTITRSVSIVAFDDSLTSNVTSEDVNVSAVQTLHSFSSASTDGNEPFAPLTVVNSALFGTTVNGGSAGDGTVFSMNTDGSDFQLPHSFLGPSSDGSVPAASLTLVGSTLFGVTYQGGSHNDGTIFSMNPDGSDYQVLYSFSGTDGYEPESDLTLVGSTLYGTTISGGSGGDGTVFSINTNDNPNNTGFRVLHSFSGADGQEPQVGLTLVGSTLYGATFLGGSSDKGTVFSINTNNNPNNTGFQVLRSFSGTSADGAYPLDGLTLVGSTLYGTTEEGGSAGDGTVFSINTNNNPNNTSFQLLHSFLGVDGSLPEAGLTLVNSTLFGTTNEGGSAGDGTVFSINSNNNPSNTGFQLLHSFLGTDGESPNSALTLDGSTLYGTTTGGGSNGDGTVFSLNELIVTPSGAANAFTVGGSPVAVDSGVTITSTDSDLTGATITIASPQSGDLLSFTSPTGSGIIGSYLSGVLTLSGSATPTQYQAALQSVTFSTSTTNTTTRAISIVTIDGSMDSSSGAEHVNVSTIQVLHSFSGASTDGIEPFASLTVVNSALFGTTANGGSG